MTKVNFSTNRRGQETTTTAPSFQGLGCGHNLCWPRNLNYLGLQKTDSWLWDPKIEEQEPGVCVYWVPWRME